jgi:hypothetical protein
VQPGRGAFGLAQRAQLGLERADPLGPLAGGAVAEGGRGGDVLGDAHEAAAVRDGWHGPAALHCVRGRRRLRI